jgi:oxygen-independent coproporphyrinogen-3 oxidase
LKALGRIHDFRDFDKTFSDARKAGFENINLDLMYGIPFQNEASFGKTVETVCSYSPEHISAYALKIEPGTVFFKNKDSLILPDEDGEYNMYKSAIDSLRDKGYGHYEISNFSKPGKECYHNLKYWSCDDYVGFGVSAHSCLKNERYAVITDTQRYIDLINQSSDEYFFTTERMDEAELIDEYVMLRLRLKKGLCLADFKNKFNTDLNEKYISRMTPFIKSGHIIVKGDSYSLSDDGMYVSNFILSEILDLK